ncbi:MAG: xanthine dehydrogenase family protein molybdopterin-binding subunit [Proteobacteria bacterium]|nr:xanthine dehydrogenase family protein molybdopterin-binding subunit [Pseudomonadota bacterium]
MTRLRAKFRPSRRQFLQGSAAAGAGLLIGFNLSCSSDSPGQGPDSPGEEFSPNAFVRIAPDGTVTVYSKHIEFGQGTYTGLATILAEELDADWDMVRVDAAPSDATRYRNLYFPEVPGIGPIQSTGGSTAMANSWQQLREAGATARAMLLAAAAQEWGVSASALVAERGVVSHGGSGQSATYGQLAGLAAAMELPKEVELKDPKDFALIGTQVPRVDVRAKSNGTAQYTMDVYLPDMLTAVIARPPRFGGKVASVNKAAALRVPGVVDVVEIPAGVAVVAEGFWPARTARRALSIEWDDSGAETRGTADLLASYRQLAGQPGELARQEGDAETAIAAADRVVEAEFVLPFLAHAPMEPLDCVIRVDNGECEVWAGSQAPTVDHWAVAQVLDLPMDKVKINTLLAGGSFGRRATFDADVATEAASIAKAMASERPIKLIWTRQDDIRGGKYRPMYLHRIRAGLDSDGNIVGWQHRIVGQSITAGGILDPGGPDTTTAEGAATLAYAIPNLTVDVHTVPVGIPVLWWRSVGHSHNAFVVEAFFDELAAAAGKDPLQLRRSLLAGHPRLLAVLDLAAEKSNWNSPLPQGKARGIAVHESFGSYVAQVAEVSLGAGNAPVVERVVCAVDCGIAINPDNIRAQMEGGIGYGLGAALHNQLDVDGGRVVQSNFHDYWPLRIHEMPQIEVHIVQSAQAPTGVGEPGLPPIAPAVTNAYRQLTGQPIRRLPLLPNGADAVNPSEVKQ